MAALVPELYVTDLAASLAFYARFGFTVRYDRPAEAFAFIERDGAALMLEEPCGRTWLAGPLERPFGRGVNLQLTVADVTSLHAVARDAAVPIIQPLEDRRYSRAADVVTVRQFVVTDPDGYLLRFSQTMAVEARA